MASRVRGARSEVRGKMEEGNVNCQYCIECQEWDELVDRDFGPRSIEFMLRMEMQLPLSTSTISSLVSVQYWMCNPHHIVSYLSINR